MTDSSQAAGSGDTEVQHPVQEALTHPMQTMTTAMEKVPGAERAKGIVDGVLDSVGIVSPRARRVAAYTGAGLLGVAGVVEWPVVAAGAAVVWLTQPRPKDVAAARTAEARAEALHAKRAAGSAKASTATGKSKTRPGKATPGTAKTRAPKKTSTSGTAKAGSSKRAATTTSQAKAGGRKKP
ncbi:hypothetical protein ACNPQM_07935 [Streptomyces sp. NPDC056231]|uniref:hypothetical protein n=1 Tax=Streptomyces sp. NPDC056231 TaxID=3345755 RepID=UPI003AB054E2